MVYVLAAVGRPIPGSFVKLVNDKGEGKREREQVVETGNQWSYGDSWPYRRIVCAWPYGNKGK